jgi:hypothetical protein
MQFSPSRCPKCGEPARAFVALVKCEVPLVSLGGEPARFEPVYSEMRSRTQAPKPPPKVTLICGGGHKWEAEVEHD